MEQILAWLLETIVWTKEKYYTGGMTFLFYFF